MSEKKRTASTRGKPRTPAPSATTPATAPATGEGGGGGLSRRRLLTTGGAAGAVGLALGATGGAVGHAVAADSPAPLTGLGATAVPFHGVHQAGITDRAQAHGHLLAFDLLPGTDRRGAAALMRRWSQAAAAMTAGRSPDGDTQAALDAGPSSLTVTFGFGRSFLTAVGLADRVPEALEPLPAFADEELDRARSDGDLFVQVGADDALVAHNAVRVLRRLAAEAARPRWQMTGFNRSPGATARPMTARNLMGQIDGTNNPVPGEPGFDEAVFVPQGGEPAWMAGGSYVVVRRIRMLLDNWENLSVERQERVIGRRKSDGAPLSGGDERTPVDLGARGADGALAIAGDAHVRVAAPESNSGATMLRRGFSYADGLREDGAPDAGLLFVAWQADPRTAFTRVQLKLSRGDALSQFVRHEASALFAVPGGCDPDGYVGDRLLEG
ncbi:iron uptake transporter deferrochelatase/peroxidase subunit [Allostreptomyces psammosilenae]|uniref:Deferrochelatase n=1 Tax=Allostreptomyces psammosilenae TaxID=1892865 RepID=A0A852ZXN4_9ACTN|nr:iron uptake transporter deferrochelatase/peroxidase subunit [Allostreptomyces psammosilenae]NYI05484.1 dye decolorizing peroxidase [Allostreptomyces psammosilenae]